MMKLRGLAQKPVIGFIVFEGPCDADWLTDNTN